MMMMATMRWCHEASGLSLRLMNAPAATPRLRTGWLLPPTTFQSLSHGPIQVPGASWVHLQFRRFAGCPVCNLHLRSFAREQAALQSAGVQTVAFFHSSAELMRPYQGDLPFPAIPDPQRVHYRAFAVERSVLAVASPRVVWSALRGLATAPANPFAGGSDQTGLPADFLVDERGLLRAVHYGAHADDQWSVRELVELAVRARR